MVLGLLKWLKETSLYERKKEIIINIWTFVYKNMNFSFHENMKGKVDMMDSWELKEIFFNAGSWWKDDLSWESMKLAWSFKKWGRWYFSSQKKKKKKNYHKIIFSIELNIIFANY